MEALLAVTSAGGVAAPLNWRWGAGEAAGSARLVGARLLAADAACLRFALGLACAAAADALQQEDPSSEQPAARQPGGGGCVATLLLLGPPASFPAADLASAPPRLALVFAESLIADGACGASLELHSAPGGAALIVYTSGTTGRPKGVALSHEALHSQSMAKLLVCGYSAADIYLHAAPLFHVGGLSSALAMLAAGARHVFLPRFTGPALLAAIQQHSVTSFIAVPTMLADLLSAAALAHVPSLPSVTRVLVGGGGMPPEVQAGLAALCPAATVHTAYGMTEGASSLTFHTLWGPRRSGAAVRAMQPAAAAAAAAAPPAGLPGGVYVGRPPPGIELAIYEPPGGQPASDDSGAASSSGGGGGGGSRRVLASVRGSPSGAAPVASGGGRVRLCGEGEVLTRGPHLMLGYWDDEDATAAALLPGGWLRTGDLGCLRQGHLWLMGRAKDMIKSGGENVNAWEVERALGSHPAVAVAAVVGAADWRLGEAVAAAVVLRPGWRWAGERCQALLAGAGGGAATAAAQLQQEGRQQQQAAAQAALAAAAAAMRPVRHGGADGGEEQAAAHPGAGVRYSEDLRSTLLQRSPSRPGSSQGTHSGSTSGGLAAALAEPPPHDRQRLAPFGALQQLAGVAAGLEQAAAAAAAAGGVGGGCTTNGSIVGGGSGVPQALPDTQSVDGRLLQAHCRASGLAGFKLPRVFLLCDSAAPAAPRGSAAVVLPVNSTGKVVKHLLRQTVQQHMAAAGGRAGGPRARL
ncbi:2-succinylbenzoate-chloroplastic peroxisomal [Micractinium conductrix]|uniref:2-succinylbenzoate-chloroplastic peroxisomal n=1 Tax=Micractinium conductrix TaxID=554055 RepID=A0A2P6VL33_9CHLO|nr:2-succinylbenzoate-chloroplastic peroxisomal [Micractinium conductrix]|eukprot:PSC74789.1 2-succinylbenzoate-chloroplastic peroxisomal [Micractinium conductrix]